MIEIKNLTKIYKAKNHKKTKAINDISLILPDTGMIFVIGKSGSGKSTLLNLIGGLDDITSGDIIVGGNNLSKFKVDDFANYRSTYIGFIFQDYHILDEFTVKENIELSADISNIDCDLQQCLKAVDLEGYEQRYPTELSGGQQQRVAIARILAKDSKIILADEPTGNLDNKTTKYILDVLKEISKTRLVIIVSHNLDDASKYADRIISLDHGKVANDVSRVEGYINDFRIENETLYLPHNTDLKEENLTKIINKKDLYNNIVQLDDGMYPTLNNVVSEEKIVLNKSKLSKEKFKKLFNLIFKRRVSNKILTIFIVSVLISLFYVFQAFNSFDENVQLINSLVDNNESVIVSRKLKSLNSTSYIFPLMDEEIEDFENSSYEGKIYKLYNQSISIDSSQLNLISYISIYNNITLFYLEETYGTLNCDEKLLIDLYGKDGKLDVYGDMYSTEYGITITDYVADSIIFYSQTTKNPIFTYDEVLGRYPKYSTSQYLTINAIVNTNYKERYNDLLKLYSNLWDNDPTNDNISEEVKSSDLYEEFAVEVNKYLGIGYNFSSNYEEYLYSTINIDNATFNALVLSNGENSKSSATVNFMQDSRLKKELTGKNIVMTTGLYNSIFGTSYNKNNLSEFTPQEINIKRTLAYENYFDEDYIIQELVYSSSSAIYLSDEEFINALTYKFFNYALYFDSINNIEELSNIMKDNKFYVLTNEASGINIVNRAIQVFGKFLNLIAAGFLLICVVSLVHFGYKSIKSNLYEIGIITALGCSNNDMGKLFVYEILGVGIGIIGVSFIGMYVGAKSSNYILLESFKQVFSYKLESIDIINFNITYVLIDLIITLFIIVISAIFPLLIIRKIKPVNILKAKE